MQRFMKYFLLWVFFVPFVVFGVEIGSEEASIFTSDLVSGTRPVIFIETQEHTPVVDKENKIPGQMWIEIPENCTSEFESVATRENPLPLTIKGRGNSSWFGTEKKSYKLKLEKKTALLGMPKHKHWALLGHALGYYDQFVDNVGFKLGEELGMDYVPRTLHVEVVLNGEYIGLYSLTESLKIDSNRIDIFEQAEENEDPETIPYGWLLEIDNYPDEFQVKVPEYAGVEMRLTHKSPEVLSDAQRDWLIQEFTNINDIIYSSDPGIAEQWVDYIDPESAVKYFIVRELLHDFDGYNGSMYLHRDLPESQDKYERWMIGPLWDMGFQGDIDKYCWAFEDDRRYGRVHWFQAITKTAVFKQYFDYIWEASYPRFINNAIAALKEEGLACAAAEDAEMARWPRTHGANTSGRVNYLEQTLLCNGRWINENRELLGLSSGIENIINTEPQMIISVNGNIVNVNVTAPATIVITTISGQIIKTMAIDSFAAVELTSGFYILSTTTENHKILVH